jgi:hypothetical protein
VMKKVFILVEKTCFRLKLRSEVTHNPQKPNNGIPAVLDSALSSPSCQILGIQPRPSCQYGGHGSYFPLPPLGVATSSS